LCAALQASADRVRFDVLSDDSIAQSRSFVFRPTMMYQSRIHTFKLRNPALVALHYDWSIIPRSTAALASALPPFSVEPPTGTIAPGASATFTLRFEPMDAEDFEVKAVFAASSPDAPAGAPATSSLVIAVSGRATRPVCHMDVPHTDYLSQRSVDLLGPNGERGPLDASVRVLHIPSLGIGVRNPKRFYVVNSTNAAYDFAWEVTGTAAAASLGSTIKCLTPRGMIGAGKRFEMAFEFAPKAPVVSEAFYRFSIPGHNLSQV
jgi:hydrocephalus-inducing protein